MSLVKAEILAVICLLTKIMKQPQINGKTINCTARNEQQTNQGC